MNIKGIIENYRNQMTVAGLLQQAGATQLSPKVAAMRPSLYKVQKALIDRPNLLAGNVPLSPLAVLFEYTLPKLESILIELGEVKAEQLIQKLCEYGLKTIADRGMQGANEHLKKIYSDLPAYGFLLHTIDVLDVVDEITYIYEKVSHLRGLIMAELGEEKTGQIVLTLSEHIRKMMLEMGIGNAAEHSRGLFKDLPKFMLKLREANGVNQILEAYRIYDQKGEDEYLEYTLKQECNTGKEGYQLSSSVLNINAISLTETAFVYLRRLNWTRCIAFLDSIFPAAGFAHLKEMERLEFISLRGVPLDHELHAHLLALPHLTELRLFSVTGIEWEEVVKMKGLTLIRISNARCDDQTLLSISKMYGLKTLELEETGVTDQELAQLKRMRPDMEIRISKMGIWETL